MAESENSCAGGRIARPPVIPARPRPAQGDEPPGDFAASAGPLSSRDGTLAPPPHRKVLDGPATRNVSCGVIIFSRLTRRCAVVRRKYSFAYRDLLRGAYRPTYFVDVLRFLLEEELALLTQMAAEPILDMALLEQEGRRCIYDYSPELLADAAEMLKKCRPYVLRYLGLPREKRGNLEEEWTFPKGRLKLGESSLDCAMRECEEELGVAIPSSAISGESLVEKRSSQTNGVGYTTTYWPVLVEDEMPLPPVETPCEVSGRRWMKLDDLGHKARAYTFEKAREVAGIFRLGA